MDAKIFRVNYKSDFILTLESDAGWMTPFCIKFWTGAPSQAYYVGWDGTTYNHCAYDPSEPTKLQVQFDDHHLPIGELKFQIAYHFTVADFPNDTEDEVINPANITTEIDGETYQVMLDFTGETAPEIQFSLPAYANEAQRIANEQQRISNEQARISQEQSRVQAEQQRVQQENARVVEFGNIQNQANDDHLRANEDHSVAVDDHHQAVSDHGIAVDDHTRAESDHGVAVDDHTQAGNDHTRAESDHSVAVDDHTQAANDHTRAESDHSTAASDHTQAGNDHTRAESDHTRAESDHAAVEVFVDSLGVFDLSKHNAVNGVLATYANLSAALTALNALESKYKYGGMSFKFVQSSDNKYVQYRYMGIATTGTPNPFLDTANWQGVDAEPTAGSRNLVESGGISKFMFHNHVIGEGDVYSETEIIGLTPNKEYGLSLDTNWSISEVASTGVYVFAIRSFDANNVVTVIDSIQITDFANIRDFYKFTVPTDSVSIKVGGRANEGDSISFTITDLDCIKRIGNSQSARIVYFKDGAVPEFEYVTGSLKVTLPAKLMYMFNNDGTELTFDVSTLVSREFTVVTTKKLVYDLDNNTISLENYSKSGNYYVLLFVGGNVQSGGSVEGGLLGYYITWLRNYNENKAIQIAKSQISTVPYFASMAVPEFEYTQSAGIKVTLPAKTMYLFTNDGTEASINLADLENREFSVANAQKLVYDFDDGSISVKNYSKVGNFYVLLFVGGRPSEYGYVGGGFAGYYNAWIKNTLQNQINRSLDSVSTGNIKKWSDFEFVFFSDVHAGWTNVQHIVDYAEAENVDCIINGGDTVLARIESGVSEYDTIVSDSSIPVLTVAGNHDCWTGSNWNWATGTAVYNLITGKVKQNVPTIVQPTDAETNGLNYYYKDFGNIRVICLLAMQKENDNLYFDSAQLSWFSDVLEDARTTLHYYKATATGIKDYTLQSGESPLKIYSNLAEMNTDNTVVANGIYAVRMSVIIVTHAPFDVDEWDEVSEKTNSYVKDDMRTHGIAYDSLKVNDSAVTAVTDYITNGGSFICWLTGHRHVDHLITNTNRDGQLMINITSAKYNLHNFDSVTIEDENNPNYDAFDHIGIDLGTGMIKVLRVGLAQDSSMRTRRSWSYDYVNNVLMSEN